MVQGHCYVAEVYAVFRIPSMGIYHSGMTWCVWKINWEVYKYRRVNMLVSSVVYLDNTTEARVRSSSELSPTFQLLIVHTP